MRQIPDSTFVFLTSHGGSRLTQADRRLLDVMAALLAEGAHVRVVCRPNSPVIEPARALGAQAAPYRLDRANLLRTRSRLRKYLKRYDPPVAHSTGLVANLLLRLAAAPLPVRVVNTIRCAPWPQYEPVGIRGRGTRRIDRSTVQRVDAFVVDCPRDPADLAPEGLDPARLHVIPTGIDTRAVLEKADIGCERPVPADTLLLAYAGDAHDGVAFDTLLEAAARARAAGRDVAVASLPGHHASPRAHSAEENGLLRVVDADNLPALLGCADVACVVASRSGVPRGLFVGGALGKPTIVTDILGTRGLLEPGREATYVPGGDVDALASAIQELASDPERARRMGERARHRVLDEYSAASAVEKYMQLYRRLMAG